MVSLASPSLQDLYWSFRTDRAADAVRVAGGSFAIVCRYASCAVTASFDLAPDLSTASVYFFSACDASPMAAICGPSAAP
ncbi:hypothetical protein [Streptomyces sp. NBC_01794]|uniref:hypothetical protein n=1 Tax=Streptomyces sp. NBC_01794 TaxID=2975942 RepID=UPI00308F2518|nr:hypothetical protein OIE54_11970 [Streptomyces sp. NBC_01794]